MLTPEQIRAVANDVTNIYSGVETACIESVVKRIQAGKKITTASLWQMKKLNDVGLLRRELIQEIKKQTKLAFPEIERLIITAVKQSRSANALSLEGLKTYKGTPKANLLSALSQSDSLAKTVKKLTASARSMFNLTNTQATQASVRAYVSSINKAYLAMSTGNATREEAIKQAVEEIGKSGIKVVDSKKKVTDNELVRKKGETYTTYYNNGSLRLYPLDSAIRRDLVTAVNQATAELTISDCNDLGTHLVETSWHNGARPEHEVWQGKVFSLDPNDTRYPYFYGSLDAGLPDYGNPLGICGINCYHSFSPYFEGTEKTTKKGKKSAEENNKQYEQQQVQRSYERRLRQLKREQVAYRAGGYTEDAQRVQALINKTGQNYARFLKDTGLTRVSMLERVEGYKRMGLPKPPTPDIGSLTTKQAVPMPTPSAPVLNKAEATYPTPETLKNYEQNLADFKAQYYSTVYKDVDRQGFIDMMNNAFENGQPSMYIRGEVVDLIEGTDGRFKTQFETGSSGGCYDKDLRNRVTESMFGVQNIGTTNHEKYGCLLDKDLMHAFKSNATGYGDTLVRLKKDIYSRTTFTIGDSLNKRGQNRTFAPSLATSPDISSLSRHSAPSFYGTRFKKSDTNPVDALLDLINNNSYAEYIELQYHGEVTLDDVEAVIYQPWSQRKPETVSGLKSRGIAVYEFDYTQDKLTKL